MIMSTKSNTQMRAARDGVITDAMRVVAEREALTPELQRTWAVRYFGLAAFLGAALYFSGSMLGRT